MKNKYFIKVFSALLVSVLFLTSCGKLADDVTVKWPDGIYLEGASKDDEAQSSQETTTSEETPTTSIPTDSSDNKQSNFDNQSSLPEDNDISSSESSSSEKTSSEDKKPSNIKVTNVPNVIREEATNLNLTEEVLKRGIVDAGNMSRLANVIRKAVRGEDVTLGVIGGSITNGTGASPSSNKYAEKFRSWWQSTFKASKLTFINAGIGATDSIVGVHRADADLLDKNPDLVIIEFSVNDIGIDSELVKRSYESLIRKTLNKSNNPAVISVFTFNQNNQSMQTEHSLIAKHYGVPAISYRDALWPAGGQKVYNWSEIAGDNVHPNNTGHAIISELLIYYVNTVRAQIESVSESIPSLPVSLTDAPFENGVLLTNKTITAESLGSFNVNNNTFWQFKEGWTVSGGTKPIIFKGNAKSIYILYKKDKNSGKGGKVEVKLDGNVIGTINSDYSTGWGDYATFYKVLDTEVSGEHEIEIKLTSTGSKTEFAILGLMVSQ